MKYTLSSLRCKIKASAKRDCFKMGRVFLPLINKGSHT